jgi:hypothetical protein
MAIEIISAPASGNIISIAYDADSQSLYVQFKYQNAMYKYTGIDGDTANGFGQALSATDYLKSAILPISVGERIA